MSNRTLTDKCEKSGEGVTLTCFKPGSPIRSFLAFLIVIMPVKTIAGFIVK